MLLTRDGDGHTGYNMGNECVDETIEDYLIDGDVPSEDKDCGPDFRARPGGPYTLPSCPPGHAPP